MNNNLEKILRNHMNNNLEKILRNLMEKQFGKKILSNLMNNNLENQSVLISARKAVQTFVRPGESSLAKV